MFGRHPVLIERARTVRGALKRKDGRPAAAMSRKKVERVEAYGPRYFIALVVEAPIERELRQAIMPEEIQRLPLHPEKRLCNAPTAERALRLYRPFDVTGSSSTERRSNASVISSPGCNAKSFRLLGVRTHAYNT